MLELAADDSRGRLPLFVEDREGRLLDQADVGCQVDQARERPLRRGVFEELVVDILWGGGGIVGGLIDRIRVCYKYIWLASMLVLLFAVVVVVV